MGRRTHHTPRTVAGIAAVAAGALTVIGLPGTAAQAAPLSAKVQAPAVAEASTAVSKLGLDARGVFLDKDGHAVVNVTNGADAQKVRTAGLRTKQVRYGYASLSAVKTNLDKQFSGTKNTSWGIDTANDQVVVTISDATPAAGANRLASVVKSLGAQARVERTRGPLELFVRGGDAIQNDQGRCSDGFNVKQGGKLMVLTAGHCTALGGTWSPMNGTVAKSDAAPADSGLITNPSGDGPSEVNTGQKISSVGDAKVGEKLKKTGSTTSTTDGSISAVDQSVNFDVGVINHLFKTDVHSDHGDSGGPGYDGSAALGTLTGGDTSTTYFYPAKIEFDNYGLSLP